MEIDEPKKENSPVKYLVAFLFLSVVSVTAANYALTHRPSDSTQSAEAVQAPIPKDPNLTPAGNVPLEADAVKVPAKPSVSVSPPVAKVDPPKEKKKKKDEESDDYIPGKAYVDSAQSWAEIDKMRADAAAAAQQRLEAQRAADAAQAKALAQQRAAEAKAVAEAAAQRKYESCIRSRQQCMSEIQSKVVSNGYSGSAQQMSFSAYADECNRKYSCN